MSEICECRYLFGAKITHDALSRSFCFRFLVRFFSVELPIVIKLIKPELFTFIVFRIVSWYLIVFTYSYFFSDRISKPWVGLGPVKRCARRGRLGVSLESFTKK